MLYQAVRRLPQGVKVVLLADRGFIHTELMQAATTQLGWHYRIMPSATLRERLKNTIWIWRTGKGWCQLNEFHFKRGEALCWPNSVQTIVITMQWELCDGIDIPK